MTSYQKGNMEQHELNSSEHGATHFGIASTIWKDGTLNKIW